MQYVEFFQAEAENVWYTLYVTVYYCGMYVLETIRYDGVKNIYLL